MSTNNNDEWDGELSETLDIGEDITPPVLRHRISSKAEPPESARPTTFVSGDLLANRYRILCFIAHGGMGEVYEAEDLELRQRIAIKTILPAVAGDPQALALLKSEVLLSLQVTHPNVCRIFNLDCHRSTAPNVLPIWFVTMELLEGHTLTWEIRKDGKLSTDRALLIAEQLASGLEAARKAKVVHGDFKSSNVILVPLQENGIRAVVTDFGLARTLEAARNSRAARVGTPAYMAPEQVNGEELSPQTDVYSFGVVLYEMVTGQWPFNADTPAKVASKRLTESPVPPVRYVPNLDPVWNRVILKCMARDPTERYVSATAAVDEITGRSRIRTRAMIAAAVLVLVMAGIVLFARYRELGPFRPKPQVAVMGWRNRSGDPAQAWISSELSERLAIALRQGTTDDVIPQQEVDRVKIEFSVPADKDLEQEDLTQFRTALGANAFLTGSYEMHNGRLAVDGVLQNTNGRPLTRFHEEALLQDLTQLVTKVTADLAPELDGREVTQQQLERSNSIYPKSLEARTLYFEAVERLRAFDADSARTMLQRVVALESKSLAAHAALAEAWSRLKYDSKAIEEGQKAVALAHTQELAPELVQATEARYADLQLRWSDAAQRYKALHDFFPSQLNYSLRYAAALSKDGKPAEALQFLDQLALSPEPIRGDPRIQAERAYAFEAESNFAQELNAAGQSVSYAIARKEKLMQADAELQVCWAQKNIGHPADAMDACELARSIFTTFEDSISAAVALNGIANIKMDQSDYKGAQEAYRQVVDITQKANAQTDSAGALLNLGKAEIYLGELAAAEAHEHQSIDLALRIEDHGDECKARVLLGSLLQDAGRTKEAKEQYSIAQRIAEQTGDRDTQASALSNLGQLALDDRSLDLAQEDLQKALTLREAMGQAQGVAKLQIRLADLISTRGQLSTARGFAEKARATSEKLGDMGSFADALCSLAEIDLSSGDYDASLKKSAQAIELYRSQHDGDSEAQAHLISARALLKQRDPQAAAEEVARAGAISGLTDTTKRDVLSLNQSIRGKQK